MNALYRNCNYFERKISHAFRLLYIINGIHYCVWHTSRSTHFMKNIWFRQLSRHLKGKDSEPILLFITILIFISFVLTSILLNYSLGIFQKNINALEKELGSSITFDGATMHLFHQLRIYKTEIQTNQKSDQRTLIGFTIAEIDFDYAALLASVRTSLQPSLRLSLGASEPKSKSEAYTSEPLKKTFLSHMIFSIAGTRVTSPYSDILLPKDKPFLQKISSLLFTSNTIPYNANIQFLQPDIHITTRGATFRLSTTNLMLKTRESSISFDSSIEFAADNILNSHVQGLLSFEFNSTDLTDAFLLRANPKTFVFSNPNILEKPVLLNFPTIQIERKNDVFSFGTAQRPKLAHRNGTHFFLDIPTTNILLKDYIENIEDTALYDFRNELLTLSSQINHDPAKGVSEYSFLFNNDSNPKQFLDIKLNGNSGSIQVSSFSFKTPALEFKYSGVIDLRDRGLSGRLSLNKQVGEATLLMAEARQYENKSIIDITSLTISEKIHNPLRIVFSPLRDNDFGIELLELENAQYKRRISSNGIYISLNEFQVYSGLDELPVHIPLLLLPSSAYLDVIKDSHSILSGTLQINASEKAQVRIQYDVDLESTLVFFEKIGKRGMKMHAKSAGVFSARSLWNDKTSLRLFNLADPTKELFRISVQNVMARRTVREWYSRPSSHIVLNGMFFDNYTLPLTISREASRFELVLGDVFSLVSDYKQLESEVRKIPVITAEVTKLPLVPYEGYLNALFELESSSEFSSEYSLERIDYGLLNISISEGILPDMFLNVSFKDNQGLVAFGSNPQKSSKRNEEKLTKRELYEQLPEILHDEIALDGTLAYDAVQGVYSWDITSPPSSRILSEFIGEYKPVQDMVYAEFDLLNIGIFLPNTVGSISGSITSKYKEREWLLSIEPSTIVVDKTKLQVESEIALTRGDVFVNSFLLETEDFKVLSEKTSIEGNIFDSTIWVSIDALSHLNFQIQSVATDAYEGLYCMLEFACVSNKFFEVIARVKATNIAEEPLTSEESISQEDLWFTITKNMGRYEFSEKMQGLYVSYSNELLDGYINKSNFVSASFSGSTNPNNVWIETNIEDFDLAKLTSYLELPDNNSIDVFRTKLSGRIFMRNSISKPLFWGMLTLSNIDVNIGILEDPLRIDSMEIFLSESNVNVSTAVARLGNSPIALSLVGRLENYTLDYLKFYFSSYPNQSILVENLLLGTTRISGSIDGSLSLEVEPSLLDISSTLEISNADISFDAFQIEKTEFLNRDTTVSVLFNFGNGVQIQWPTRNFPVLKGLLTPSQDLIVNYDSRNATTTASGSLKLTSGNIFYFDKSFNIQKAEIDFTNPYNFDEPFVYELIAEKRERYKNNNHTIKMEAQNEYLTRLQPTITAKPPLNPDEISSIIGQSLVNNTNKGIENESTNPIVPVLSLGNPIANIGLFSRFGDALRTTLKLDYVSIRSDIVQNLVAYSLIPTPQSIESELQANIFGTLFDNSSIEFGKYFDSVYVSLLLQLETDTPFTNVYTSNIINKVDVNTAINVDIPTPVFDISWTFDSTFKSQYDGLLVTPLSYLSISYTQRY